MGSIEDEKELELNKEINLRDLNNIYPFVCTKTYIYIYIYIYI